MVDRIPSGTRDVLPDEMRELRAMTDRIRDVFERAGYGEVYTPALEYENSMATGWSGITQPAYRMFDEQGNVLVLRTDMTIPIARLVATRFDEEPGPLRLCYLSHAYRAVTPQRGQQREFLQAGLELIGAESPGGTVEVIEVLCAALDAAGLPRARVGLGDAGLYRGLLEGMGAEGNGAGAVLLALERRDFVELEARVADLGVSGKRQETLATLPQLRGGPEVLDRAVELGGDDVRQATQRLRDVVDGVTERGLADRVIFDLGLVRDLGYYTGAIFEVYDPALGHVIGAGGRYDDLIGRFGDPRPACGFALFVERLHVAQAEEERRAG